MGDNTINQILVLDSNEISRNSLCDIIRELDVKEDNLFCAASIEEALDIINTKKVLLTFVDLSDAKKQGYSICSLLTNGGNESQVVAFIDKMGPIDITAIKVHGILKKPCEKDDIKWYIEKASKIRKLVGKIDDTMSALTPADPICGDCPES